MSGSSLVLGTIEQFLTVMPLELRKKTQLFADSVHFLCEGIQGRVVSVSQTYVVFNFGVIL